MIAIVNVSALYSSVGSMLIPASVRAATVVAALALAAATAVALVTATRRAESLSFAAPVCDDATAIDVKDAAELRTNLAPLIRSNFFSIFHVSLDTPCPFWNNDDGKCAVRECSVCNCPDNEVPIAWRAADSKAMNGHSDSTSHNLKESLHTVRSHSKISSSLSVRKSVKDILAAELPAFSSPGQQPCEKSDLDDALNDVDRSHPGQINPSLANWASPSNPDDWIVQDAPNSELIYVDLRKNPERYTGYSGSETHRVWSAIYDENCFTFSSSCKSGICAPGTCKEERILYRLISGVHTSISMHIAHEYLRGTKWISNRDTFVSRVRAFPERVTNLYVALALVLRAVAKVSVSLDPAVYDYSTGNTTADNLTAQHVRSLLAHPLLKHGCENKIFDESDMFVERAEARLPEFRSAFRNISMIMDCVGCEKCRLWGKLQFLGLGTALRLLFSQEHQPELKRNEAIALFNLLNKLLSSTVWIDEMNRAVEQRAAVMSVFGKLCAVSVFLIAALWLNHSQQKQRRKVHSGGSGAAKKSSKQSSHREKTLTRQSVDISDTSLQNPDQSQNIRRRKKASVD